MNIKTLEQAFDAVFHDKDAFNDFCSLDLSKEIEPFTSGTREVVRITEKLKKYLRFVDRVILRHLNKNLEVAHSYIKGKSSLTAVQAHAGSTNFFVTDIRDFFSKITEEHVRRVFDRDKHLIPIEDIEEHLSHIVRMTTWEGVIPVGFPTSPQISNAFLLEFDAAFHNHCAERNLIYTRYSDDIIVSGKTFLGFDALQDRAQELLSASASPSLTINSEKTRFTHRGNKVKILGLVITPDGRVTIDSKHKQTIENLFHFYINDKSKFNALLQKKFNGNPHSLFGLLHYAKSIDSRYLDKLQRKYGANTLSALMEDKWRG